MAATYRDRAAKKRAVARVRRHEDPRNFGAEGWMHMAGEILRRDDTPLETTRGGLVVSGDRSPCSRLAVRLFIDGKPLVRDSDVWELLAAMASHKAAHLRAEEAALARPDAKTEAK